MSLMLKCHRCHKEYEADDDILDKMRSDTKDAFYYEVTKMPDVSHEYGLCPSCAKDLDRWIQEGV